MDKYGVDETVSDKIAGDATGDGQALPPAICPSCGAVLELHGRVALCPKCGSKPFEVDSNGN